MLNNASYILRLLRQLLGSRLGSPSAYACGMVALAMSAALAGCRIEPPLKLAGRDLHVEWPEVETDVNVVWDIDVDWESEWFYGWDQEDIDRWGPIEYPAPESYNVHLYFYGNNDKLELPKSHSSLWVRGSSFRRRFDYGWHDLLFYSDVITYDGTQAVIFDDSDPYDIQATTSRSRLSFHLPGASRSQDVYNNPEIFYRGYEEDFYVSDDYRDYDYYDDDRKVWVKKLHSQVYPAVYIYLVQVIIYNNRGRIIGLADNAAMTSMADGVNLRRGHTSLNDIVVAFPMKLKYGLRAFNGREADIMGSKFTTFGLCGMSRTDDHRGPEYIGSRPELLNYLSLDLAFNNATDSAYNYHVTDQLQRQSHGGVITVEIDADTIRIPTSKSGSGSCFKPTVENYGDSIIHEFPM